MTRLLAWPACALLLALGTALLATATRLRKEKP